MLVQEQLILAYAKRGLEVTTGGMLARGGDIMQEFTSVLRDGKRLGTGWGMSFTELAALEFLSQIWQPRSIYGIGVAFGWSTVALRLFFPAAKIACLDAGVEGLDNMAGIKLTQDILADVAIPTGSAAIELGFSPKDTPRTVETHLDGRINFAFIDGMHTNDQQTADFESIRPYLDAEHVVFFHDVRFCKMQDSLRKIAQGYGARAAILSRTTSGIGVVYSENMAFRMGRLTRVFGGQPIEG